MWWLAALIGGAIKIGGNIWGRRRRAEAAEEAIAAGRSELYEGQDQVRMNASQAAQDNAYTFALSGVRNDVGTPVMLDSMVHNQKAASVNRMSRDYERWAANVRTADETDAINTGFNIAGDVFSTFGQLYYDRNRFLEGGKTAGVKDNARKELKDNPSYKSSSFNIENTSGIDFGRP
jgi:hypothetical protein